MTSNKVAYAALGIASLALVLTICGKHQEDMTPKRKIAAEYSKAPMALVRAGPGKTIEGLTSETSKGVPVMIRRNQFARDNDNTSNEITAGNLYFTRAYTNNYQ